jgi:DNA-binding transcriptional LysR family regulator
MELRQLRYFVTVAEELHFARAAERLDISPPTLTQQIQVLEKHLGTRLFHRTKRTVTLSDAGLQLLAHARETLRHAEHTEMVGKLAGRGEVGRVEIGYITSAACAGFVSAAIESYRKNRPLVDVRIHCEETTSQLKRLSDGHLDVGFLRPPATYPAGLTGFPALDQALVVALPSDHKLVGHKTLSPKMLRRETFISHSVETDVAFANYVDSVATAGHFLPRISRRTDMVSILTLVAAKVGIAIVPGSFQYLKIPGLVYRPLAQRQRANIALAFRGDEKSQAVLAFVRMIRSPATRPIVQAS